MKKILITATTLPRWKGDAEPRFVLDFAKSVSKKYKVTILAPSFSGALEHERLEGIEILRYHYFPIHSMETLCYPGSIMGRIKEKKSRIFLVPFLLLSLTMKLMQCQREYDFIIANWIIPQGIIQSFFKKPYMIICHGSDVKALNKGILKLCKQKALKKAKAVAVVSNELKQQLKDIFLYENPFVLPMGVNISDFNNIPGKAEHDEFKTVLFVGRLEKIKGVEYLIEAMKYIDARLLIVGDGNLRDELENKAKEQGEKIRFLGAVEHSRLPRIYAAADVFVAPSITLDNGGVEGFGLVLIEAMAAGTPVVGTRSGGIKDIISDGENGYLVEEKNSAEIARKVNKLLNNPALSKAITECAKKTVLRYDWEAVGDRYIELIDKCMCTGK